MLEVALTCLNAPITLFIEWCHGVGIHPGHRVERAHMEARVAHDVKEFKMNGGSGLLQPQVSPDTPVEQNVLNPPDIEGDSQENSGDSTIQTSLSNTSIQNIKLDSTIKTIK